MTPPAPNESQRLGALRRYDLTGGPSEAALDELTQLAAQICQAPIAVISLVGEDRQSFCSRLGMPLEGTPRNAAFCDYTIRGKEPFFVADAQVDPRFAQSPLVTADPFVRFYAGAPLVSAEGLAIGAICVMDRVPRTLAASQLEALCVLSRQVMSHLDLQRQARALSQSEERLRVVTENARIGLVIVDREHRYVYANRTYAEILQLPSAEIVGLRVREVLPSMYDEQIRPRLDRAFASERVNYELHRPDGGGGSHYTVNYEPTKVGGEVHFVVVVIADVTERRRMELQLRHQEAVLEETGRIASVGGWEFDPATGQGSWTAEVARLHELDESVPPNMAMGLEFYLPGSRERIAEAVDRAVRLGTPYDLELEMRTVKGNRRWVRTIGRPILQDGRVVRVRGSIQDITQRRQNEAATLEAMRLAQATIDALAAHLCVLDEKGTILTVNQAWKRLAEANGLPGVAWEGQNYLEVCDAAAGVGVAEAASFAAGIRAVVGGSLSEFLLEYPCHAPSEQRWFCGRVTRFAGEGPVRVVVAHEEITERKISELAAMQLAAIVRSSDDAIVGKDLQGIVTSWNRGAEQIFGYSAAEMVGTSIRRIVPEDRQEEETEILERVRRGERVRHFETIRQTRDGRQIHVAVTCSPILDSAGQVMGVSKVARDITAQKATELALATSRGLLRSVLDSTPSIVFATDREHRYIAINEAGARFVSRPVDEILGRTLAELLPPEKAAPIYAADERIMASGQGEQTDETVLDRVFMTTKVPLFDAQGRVTGLCGVATDITARKVSEEARRVSEERYRALFEYAPDGILIADHLGHYLDANANACRLLGYGRQELIGRHARDLIAVADSEAMSQAMHAIRSSGEPQSEWILRRKDGSHFPAEVMASTMPDGHLLVMIRDITERKRVESRFRRLVDSDAHGVMFWNTAGGISGANASLLRMLGYSRAELENGELDWKAITPPEFAELDQRNLATLAATGVCAPTEKEFIRKDGTRVPVLAGAAVFEDNPSEGVCFVVDLSERKKLEQQFLRSQRLESIGTLAGGIAHDLNNILGPIQMAIELLQVRVTDPLGRNLLATLGSSAQRGADMVRQVLSFARGMEGRRMEVQIRHLLSDIEKIANDTFLKHIRVQSILPRDLWTVVGDPTQLHQLLLNLCVNARDAMPAGGQLTLSAENLQLDAQYIAPLGAEAVPGPYVHIQVEDTGTGMTPEVMEKIFDPFFTTKELGKGTGLGLSTSLAILKSHGGFVRVYSEVGKGTKFDVFLPAQTSISAESAAQQAAEMPRGAGELILVVDDEASIRQVTQQTLEAFGYSVLVANDGAEAVAVVAVQGGKIKAVLTDMMMPVMDGPATIRVVRRLHPDLPIIAASGLAANNQMPQQMADLGVKHFLAKPYAAEALLKLLHQILHP